MKTITLTLPDFKLKYPLEVLAPLENILFIDIETTGFTAKNSNLYLIGCIYYQNDSFKLIQWFAEHYEEEQHILEAFSHFSNNFNYLIHFNGNNFDLPYLLQKGQQYGIPLDFSSFDGTDIYRRIAPYKSFLKLPNCKQKTLETYLGISREDIYNGGELIGVYHDYVLSPSQIACDSLLLHNKEDMIGMLELLPILSYVDLFNRPLKVTKVQANYYKDHNGEKRQELIMKVKLPTSIPVAASNYANGSFFSGIGSEGTIKVPIFEGELKYYYANYKDYYYLPAEDVALHRSVASFVDKNYRVPATASNCYTRKESVYLPQWDILFEPFFKLDYKSKDYYFELTDELKQERDVFSAYAQHILQNIVSSIYQS